MSTPEEPPVESAAEAASPTAETPTTVQPVVRERTGFNRWIRTPLGIGIAVGALMLALCVIPAGVAGVVVGSHFGRGGNHMMVHKGPRFGPKGRFNRQWPDGKGRLRRLPPGQVPGPVPGQPQPQP